MSNFWDSFFATLQSLSPQHVALFSAMIGIPLGFLTLVAGALLNSHLNRKRDDRLRRMEVLGVATALLSEVVQLKAAVERNIASLKAPPDREDASHAFIPEMIVDVWRALTPKVTLLEAQTIEAVLVAYGTLPIYVDRLSLAGGELSLLESKRVYVAVPVANVEVAISYTESLVPLFDKAICALRSECQRLK